MQTTNLDLQKMGLTPLTETEMQKVDGSGLIQKIAAAAVSAALVVYNFVTDKY